jgi:3-oxoadipate CoA-transferase, alpha subunit
MIDKIASSVGDTLADVPDGAAVMMGGFGTAGFPGELVDGLVEQGAR